MSEQDVQTMESQQVAEQNGEGQDVKAEVVEEAKVVQPIIVPLQIMPCFYTGPFNNAPTPVQEEPVEEKEEEPIPQKKTHFVRAHKEKKPKEDRPKRNALQVVCAVLLVIVCAGMFALSFLGVVDTDFKENLGSGIMMPVDMKIDFSTIDLVDFMYTTTLDFEDEIELQDSDLAKELEDCQQELSESLRADMQHGNSMSAETKKIFAKMIKLGMKAEIAMESANGSVEEVHFIIAGALSLVFMAVTAIMLALAIAWLVYVCQGKQSNLGKVTVCMTAVLFVLLVALLLHMIELSVLKFSIAITMICALAICGAVLLTAFILGIARAPKEVRGMVAIKATSAVLVLSVIAFAFAPAIVHIVKFEACEVTVDKTLSQLESTILTEDELELVDQQGNGISVISEELDYIGQAYGQDIIDGENGELIITMVDAYTEQAFLRTLVAHDSQIVWVFSLGYFMIFAVAIMSGVCLALIFDFILGGKNHVRAELALKVIIAILALFILAVCSSAIGIVNAEYKDAGAENMSVMVGYGVAMMAVMSLFSLALDSVLIGIANKKAKAPVEAEAVDVDVEPSQPEPAVA